MSRTTIVMDEATAEDAAEGLQRIWWLLLADGILSLIIGFLVLSWREQTLHVLAIFLGIWLCVVGVLQLASGIRAFSTRWPYAIMGLVALGAGIATLVWPHVTLYVLATILGWVLMLWGICDVIGAFLRRQVPHWWLGIIKGVVLFVLGIWADSPPRQRAHRPHHRCSGSPACSGGHRAGRGVPRAAREEAARRCRDRVALRAARPAPRPGRMVAWHRRRPDRRGARLRGSRPCVS